jgi:hypothetical protein
MHLGDYTAALEVLKINHPSTYAVPHHELQFGYLRRWTEQGIGDGRSSNRNTLAVGKMDCVLPSGLVEVIRSLLASLCSAKAEVDATMLQPVVQQYVASLPEYRHVLHHATTNPKGFTASPNWIRFQLHDMDLNYKKVTNLAGKLHPRPPSSSIVSVSTTAGD